ncbi:MAG: efflux RND transporter permease subunit [Proteobacteria bacterium]|nr:efflux RND transporter permease subunit [Pseudomonadota bacterium]
MFDGIIRWSLQNRLFVILGAGILLAWGALETIRMPVDVFPDLTAPTVTIITEAHGMAPEELETLVTFPIETALNGASGVRRVRSSTAIGIAVIWVEFDWGTDIYRARQIVSEKLQDVRSSLPPEVDPPLMAPISSIMGEIMFMALTSDVQSPIEVRTVADWVIRRRLLAVPGVSQVSPIGGEEKQFQVILNPERLAAYGVGTNEVIAALKATNQNTSAGFYLEGGQEYLIQGQGRVTGPEDIGETLVAMRDDQPILIRNLAEVRIGGPAFKRGEGSFNGRPAIVLGIQKQPDANTLELTRRLDEVLDDIQTSLPKGMVIHSHVFRQADFIEVAIHNVSAAMRDGGILVVFIMLVFLMSLRATGITILAIPLSLLAAVLAMKAIGTTINTMTLGGMAIAVGALVDDAIIVNENVVRRLRQNATLATDRRRSLFKVIFEATREIRGSIVFATFIIILVFVPLFFLSGVEGRLLRPLGFAYVVSLFASLVVALTVTPALCSFLLPRSRAVQHGLEPAAVRWVKAVYDPILSATMVRWKTVVSVSLAGLIVASLGLIISGRAFLPDFNEGALTIGAVTLPGASLKESDDLGRMIEQILLRQEEIVATARRTGRAELDEHALGVNSAEIDIGVKLKERSKEKFLVDLRRELSIVPGMNITIGQPISHRIDHMLSGTRANIAVKIFGDDLYELRRTAEAVRVVMEGVEGVVDLSIEQQTDIPFVTVRFDRTAIARQGLRIQDVAKAIETAFRGRLVSRVLDGQAAFDLVVRYDTSSLENFNALRETLIATPSGRRIPLHALAKIRKDRGPNTISRENVQRKIVVMCNVAGRDLSGVVDDIRNGVRSSISLPQGYHVEYGGQFESAEKASRTLTLLGLAVVIGIFSILFIAFRSARDTFLVMVNLPLALIGGVAGVFLSGGILSIASIIGFITVFGIATRNGIMMISHIHYLMEHEGVRDMASAVKRGAMERLVPILMTALASGLALVPLALSGGEPGSEIQTPMAIVILFGLLSSTVLNMVVVPALYRRFGSLRPELTDRTS